MFQLAPMHLVLLKQIKWLLLHTMKLFVLYRKLGKLHENSLGNMMTCMLQVMTPSQLINVIGAGCPAVVESFMMWVFTSCVTIS